jgi:hypothetical protein
MKIGSGPKKAIIALLLSCFLGTSCFFSKSYPNRWPTLTSSPDKKCTQILGTYEDIGETADKKPQPISLSSFLFSGVVSREPLSGTTSVLIAKPDEDTLEISVWKGEERLFGQTFSQRKKEFSCTPKGIEIFQGSRGMRGGEDTVVIGKEWRHINLATGADGSLVVNPVSTQSGVGFVLIIPVPLLGGDSTWYRFKCFEKKGPCGGKIAKSGENVARQAVAEHLKEAGYE